jgi:hypothetical protein
MTTAAPDIFSQLAQHDTDKIAHDQSIAQSQDIFDQIAANNGQAPAAVAPTQAAPPQATIGPTPKASDMPTFGESWQTPEQRLTMPLVKGLVMLHDKLRDIENFTQEGRKAHPIQAKIGDLANNIEGLLVGNESHPETGIGSGKYGILNNPITGLLLPGGEGAPAAFEAMEGAGSAIKSGVQAAKGAITGSKTAKSAAGIVEQIKQGANIAQEPAKQAVRGAVEVNNPMLKGVAEDEPGREWITETVRGAPSDAKLLEGNKSIVDEHLESLSKKENLAYQKQDAATGFDMKALHEKLANTEDQIRQLTETEEDVAKEAKLEKARTAIIDKIQDANARLREAGIDPNEADAIFKSRKAGEDFKKALVQNVSADGEAVNVEGLLNAAKKLRFSKYGDRLEQFMGKEGANNFMQQLQDAQKAGVHAMKTQRVAKWFAGIVGASGLGVEAAKLLSH